MADVVKRKRTKAPAISVAITGGSALGRWDIKASCGGVDATVCGPGDLDSVSRASWDELAALVARIAREVGGSHG